MGLVQIVYRPIREIVVMEYVRYDSPEELVMNTLWVPGQPATLFWAEGVVFLPVPLLPSTDTIANDFRKGRVYWTSVSYAPMPDYKVRISVEMGPEVSIINVVKNETLRKVALWLKERK